VWIEIFNLSIPEYVFFQVAPFAGVWIEIKDVETISPIPRVAPFAGVWIEIF